MTVQYVKSFATSLTGVPILDEFPLENQAFSTAITLALKHYWTCFPYEYMETVKFVGISSNIVKTIESIKEEAFPNPVLRSKAFYLGPTRISEGQSIGYQGSSWNDWLLGLPKGTSLSITSTVGMGSQLARSNFFETLILSSSVLDETSGRLEYQVDTVNNVLRIMIPHQVSEIAIWHGFGIDDDTLSVIPNARLVTFAKLVTMYFIQTVISARSSVQIESDFTLNTSFLETKLGELREDLSSELAYGMMPVVWT